jgi:hypothetical protein
MRQASANISPAGDRLSRIGFSYHTVQANPRKEDGAINCKLRRRGGRPMRIRFAPKATVSDCTATCREGPLADISPSPANPRDVARDRRRDHLLAVCVDLPPVGKRTRWQSC